MMELRRKKIRSLERGDVCYMTDSAREILKATDDYFYNGNINGYSNNYLNKLHPADAEIFYVCNDKPFNSSKMIEVIPVRFIHDHIYSGSSFKIAIKKRMKLTMKKEDFLLIPIPNRIEAFSILNQNIEIASKKFKLNLEPWKKLTENK